MSPRDEADVVVVGAGSSGAALAARLAEGGRRVALVERGDDVPAGARQGRFEDPDRIPSRDDARVSAAQLLTGDGDRPLALLSGAVVGGSSSVNGAYFVRPTDDDLDRWAAAGNDRWSLDRLLPAMRRLEADAEMRGPDRHGADGPVPVTRRGAAIHAVTEAFLGAADALGHPEQPDLNGGGAPGWGLLPRNVDEQGRVSSARAYLVPERRGQLDLRTRTTVQRVVVEHGRAVGVEVLGPDGGHRVLRARTVVSSAGALGSAALLWRSGIGAAADLAAAGIPVVADVAGLGARPANHAALDLQYEPVDGLELRSSPLLQAALHLQTDSGTPVEVLATCRPYGVASGDEPDDRRLSLRVTPMSDRARGRVVLSSPPVVQSGYLVDERDRVDLRAAVRAVAELAHGPVFAPVVARWLGPEPATLGDDAALDAWIVANLGTAHHLCATAPMGPPQDPMAVVDQDGRVRGVEGLRVVDVSILPDAPTRGPACIAIALAEHLAATFD